jgi:hypothetical protein
VPAEGGPGICPPHPELKKHKKEIFQILIPKVKNVQDLNSSILNSVSRSLNIVLKRQFCR